MGVRLDLLHQVTDDELLRLSRRNPGWQFERNAEGELVMSPAGGESGYRSAEVLLQLGVWNRRHGLGLMFDSSTGFNLPDGSCLSPDAAWVHRNRWQALTREQRRRYLPLAPDAAFELRSESDRLSELRAKMETYLANGTALAVLIDPETRAVEVYRPQKTPQRYDGAAPLPLDPELPGFALEVQPLFAEP